MSKKYFLYRIAAFTAVIITIFLSSVGYFHKARAADDIILSFPATATASPGGTVNVDLGITVNNGALPAYLEWNLTYNSAIITDITMVPADGQSALIVATNQSLICDVTAPGNHFCQVLFGDPLPTGTLITFRFTLANTAATSTNIGIFGLVSQTGDNETTYASSASGLQINITQPSGSVPAVSLTVPADGATVYGSTVTITASSSDASGINNVKFYRDGSVLLATVNTSPYTISWDTLALSGGSHSLSAVAANNSGVSATSTPIYVTVDNEAPIIYNIATSTTLNIATIFWSTVEPATSQVEYGLTSSYTSSSTLNSTATTTHSVIISGLVSNTLYHYRILSADSSGNLATSTDKSFFTTSTSDSSAPTVPSSLAAMPVSVSEIDLSWTLSTDNVGVAGYQIFRCQGASCAPAVQIATSTINSYQNQSLVTQTAYTYAITAFDAALNISSKSSSISATTQANPDITAPTVPTGLSAIAVSSSQINLSWAASIDPTVSGETNSGVAGYHVFLAGTQIATTTSASYSNTGLSVSTAYSYKVSVYDAAGNESSQSSSISATTQSSGGGGGGGALNNNTTPNITNFLVQSGDGQAVLSWVNPSNSSGWTQIIIIRKISGSAPTSITDGTRVYEGTGQSFVDTGLSNNMVYFYAVFTLNSAGVYLQSAVGQATLKAGAILPSLPPASSSNMYLINQDGTFYLAQNGARHGITSPGILFSYGYDWTDAFIANSSDRTLPQGDLVLPGNGSLVKSKEDPTVYLISGDKRYGFTAAFVFLGLGFKWTSILIVTNPELQKLPKASNLSDPKATHLPGLNINDRGTVFWVGDDGQKHAYPSLDVYNSWRHDNDFSWVVPANAADLAFPTGSMISKRVLQR